MTESPPHEAAPLDLAEAAELLAPLRAASKLLLAVSGGPDSVALMGLTAKLRLSADLPPIAVGSVDHGLLDGSAVVAQEVVDRAAALGLESHLLQWEGPKPSTGLQRRARDARYGLLTGLAHRIAASHLVTAHTLDDQAETILFRMARGSGPSGLAGIKPESTRDGVVLCRPFLPVPKARLRATCDATGWPYVLDPANMDARFARARLRGLMPRLAAEGLDARMLATLGARLAADEDALREWAATCRTESCLQEAPKRQVFDAAALLRPPLAVTVRVLDAVLTNFASPGPPRLGRLEALAAALAEAFAGGKPLRRTLHAARVTLTVQGQIEFVPEGERHRGRRFAPG